MPPSSAKTQQQHLDASLVRGVAWTGASKWLTQIFTLASTLIVARLLTPNDFGVVTMGTIYLGLVALVSQFGVDAAVINMQELESDELAQLNGFSVILGIVGLVASVMIARPLSFFFASPQLPAVLILMSCTF